jgi:uncharacterized heparinase superfamily protein
MLERRFVVQDENQPRKKHYQSTMFFPPTWSRYWHTLRHLQARQWTARLKRKLVRPKADARPAPSRRAWEPQRWQSGIAPPASLQGPNTWRLLNETHKLSSLAAIDPALSHLWRYHVHYFDDLRAGDSSSRSELQRQWIENWMQQCPPGTAVAWDPYPTSLRIVNWLKWAWQEGSLPAAAWQSLATQTRWLAQDLEYHLLGNHLLANAKALVFAGCAFGGEEGDRWLRTGLEIYREQLPEQILSDGGHFELSPMYHAIVLEDLLDVWNLAQAAAIVLPSFHAEVQQWEPLIHKMRTWLAALTHPDGTLAHFNDSTQGQSASTHELEEYAVRLGFAALLPQMDGVTLLKASGYVRCQLADAVLILDAGKVGPDYLPGHAHADTLSFELSLGPIRTLLNAGISCYGVGPARLAQRGTAAHNTVVVNDADSSEVWSGFRVARRAAITELAIETLSREKFRIRAAHDGYRRLHKSIQHRRTWTMEPGRLLVEDEMLGTFATARSHFRLGPGWKQQVCSEPLHWAHAEQELSCTLHDAQGLVLESEWYPGFGLAEPVPELRCTPNGSSWAQEWQWGPSKRET